MSSRELERVEVIGRVANKSLKLVHAAEILRLSYRQVKRLWKVYQQAGAVGLQHRHAGKPSNRAKPEAFHRKVLRLVAKKYSGSEEERFGTHAGGGTFGGRRPAPHRCRNLASLDVARGFMDAAAKTQGFPQATSAQAPFWRTGATGRQLP